MASARFWLISIYGLVTATLVIGCGQKRSLKPNRPYPIPARVITTPSHFKVLLKAARDKPVLLWTRMETGFQLSSIPANRKWIQIPMIAEDRHIRLAYDQKEVGPLSPTFVLRPVQPAFNVQVDCSPAAGAVRVRASWSTPDNTGTSRVTIASQTETLAVLSPQNSQVRVKGKHRQIFARYEDSEYESQPWLVNCGH